MIITANTKKSKSGLSKQPRETSQAPSIAVPPLALLNSSIAAPVLVTAMGASSGCKTNSASYDVSSACNADKGRRTYLEATSIAKVWRLEQIGQIPRCLDGTVIH